MTTEGRRPLAIVTGAGGGMGAACARVLGRRYRLILTDLRDETLDQLVELLVADGFQIAARICGDLSDRETIARLADAADSNGGLDALVHPAAISPTMGTWDKVLRVNLGATIDLLDTLETRMRQGGVCVLVASLDTRAFEGELRIDKQLATLKGAEVVQAFAPLLDASPNSDDPLRRATTAYGVTKYAVRQLVELRAQRMGTFGARIVGVCPGMIATPMGKAEVSGNPVAEGLVEAAPAGRWGTPIDIASAVEFLVSDAASFITGCNLRVDGGLSAKLNSDMALAG